MSYAIIRNTKYKRENLKGIFRHNERRNQILLRIGFFIVLFIIGIIDEFIRHKFNQKK